MQRIYYFHGMGGGSDSRIPSILKEHLPQGIELYVRTYDFDPEVAHAQAEAWMKELAPDLVIGESLGALHALRVPDVQGSCFPCAWRPIMDAVLFRNLSYTGRDSAPGQDVQAQGRG